MVDRQIKVSHVSLFFYKLDIVIFPIPAVKRFKKKKKNSNATRIIKGVITCK